MIQQVFEHLLNQDSSCACGGGSFLLNRDKIFLRFSLCEPFEETLTKASKTPAIARLFWTPLLFHLVALNNFIN
ncbi:hypothetical protein MHH70_16025 [Metasolibacillus sp. FSL H7-0170]|uniref:hypothetical protein n=1 Tax=Metasolibacillus TaxID=2703677 RepID=UPI0007935468|nr:hypothetical protein [Metasolibacillus fluoroglycofenilyticus]KYG90648.1 hypothetical protein A0U40_06660 [[Bacillus] sp. KCTC 13219]